MEIDTSLLREKFVIKEKNTGKGAKALSLICPSTRMPVDLQSSELIKEKFIIRSCNMHSCARMAAQIIYEYDKGGSLINRAIKVDWAQMWDKALSSYERRYNDNRWVAVYHKGKPIFSSGERHPFLDVIEQCDIVNKGSYEESIQLAEEAFAKAGKKINLDYDSNIALVSILGKKDGRCSMVLRGAGKTTIFNYSIKPKKKDDKIHIPQGLSSAADFLEAVQLSYMVGINNEKIELGIIKKYSDEYRQTMEARKRISELNALINSMENRYNVHYRPERPDFDLIIELSEKYAQEFRGVI